MNVTKKTSLRQRKRPEATPQDAPASPSQDSLIDLQRRVNLFCKERDWDQFHAPKNVAMALAIEAAEVMEPMRWMSEKDSWTLDTETFDQVKAEIGDVMFCLLNLCQRLDVDPIEACRTKLLDAAKKYPVATSRGNARKYRTPPGKS